MKDIAAAIGYTENYISRCFKKEAGMSVLEYINRRKVEIAEEILRHAKTPVGEISDQLSFSSPSYFTAVFRKYTGKTPLEYQSDKG